MSGGHRSKRSMRPLGWRRPREYDCAHEPRLRQLPAEAPAPHSDLHVQVIGTRWAVAAGHSLAAEAGARVLGAGGNADRRRRRRRHHAGRRPPRHGQRRRCGADPRAHRADRRDVAGLRRRPVSARDDGRVLRERHGGQIPAGPAAHGRAGGARCLVHGARALGHDVLRRGRRAATEHAERGFAVSAVLRLPDGRQRRQVPPLAHARPRSTCATAGRSAMGEVLVQRELGETLRRMVARRGEGRRQPRGAASARRATSSTGARRRSASPSSTAPRADRSRLSDLAEFERGGGARRCARRFGRYEVAACGFWCQGPSLLQMLNMLDGIDLKALGHNSPAYLHRLIETIKLAFADRDAYYGDPHFVKIRRRAPLEGVRGGAGAARQGSRLAADAAGRRSRPARRRQDLEAALPLAGGSRLPRRTRSTRATSPSSTRRATASRPRPATRTSTRPSSPASAASCRRAARRAGSTRSTRASWRPASGRVSRPAPAMAFADGTPPDAVRHPGRRRPAAGDAPGLPQRHGLRHAIRRSRSRRRASRRAVIPTRSGRTRSLPARSRPSAAFRARRCDALAALGHAVARVARLGVARGRGVRGQGRPGRHPLGRRRPAPRRPRDRAVGPRVSTRVP